MALANALLLRFVECGSIRIYVGVDRFLMRKIVCQRRMNLSHCDLKYCGDLFRRRLMKTHLRRNVLHTQAGAVDNRLAAANFRVRHNTFDWKGNYVHRYTTCFDLLMTIIRKKRP